MPRKPKHLHFGIIASDSCLMFDYVRIIKCCIINMFISKIWVSSGLGFILQQYWAIFRILHFADQEREWR